MFVYKPGDHENASLDAREDVIALFPEMDAGFGQCESYMHVGQHSGADYRGVISITRPAKPSEYASLKRELENIGYNLDVRKKR